jgi:hypothetical protein
MSGPLAEREERWPLVLTIALGLTLALAIGYLKLSALYAWRYTSDLFTIDLMLQETLKGHFALEYTYGRQLGDHALLILFALLPIKWVLGKYMVALLVLLPAISFAVCGLIFFRSTRTVAGASWATLASAIYFLSIGAFRGPFEIAYGFHIDTLAGYVAVAMAAVLLRDNVSNARTSAFAIALICLFALLKEEMALLGIIFFLVLLVFVRNRLHLLGLFISVGLFAVEMLIIRLGRCPWNRTNEALIQLLLTQIRRHGFFGFFFSAEKMPYWMAIFSLLLLIVLCFVITRRFNPYVLALTLIGLAKLGFSWFVKDFDPWTWHNYPGIVMLTGALALQALELRHIPINHMKIAATSLLALCIGAFAAVEAPFFFRQVSVTAKTRERNAAFVASMSDVVKQVEKERVAAVPRYCEIAWTDGHRYTFHPKGISQSPRGIADYLVIAKNNPNVNAAELKAFKLIYQNRRYRLYGRKSYLPGEQESRQMWIQWFGRATIGPIEKRPSKKPTTTPASSSSPG